MNDEPTVEDTVLDVLASVLDETAEDLRARPVLAAHDWTSISSLDALAQLESKFGVRLDLRAFHSARTVNDLVTLIEPASVRAQTV